MKKPKILPILIATALVLMTACNTKQTPGQSLKDDNQRKEIITTIAKSNSYAKEMMQEMMNNDSCKHMMMESMMAMCKDDTAMCKKMMGKTMEMCDKDTAKCKMMMGCMHPHTNVMKAVKGMHSGEKSGTHANEKKVASVVYTCSMHPEILRDKPGQCPKCGMDLIIKK